MILSDALVEALCDWGVGYVFGVSGANIEHFHDSIHRLGPGRLQSIMTRREDAAAYMADARGRVHRTLGVCCSTAGGALLNLAVGLAESYAESVPVLAIVGQAPTAFEGKGAFQDGSGIGRAMSAKRFLETITKYTAKVDDPARFWEQLETAARAALSGRQGPTALLVARDMFMAEVPPAPAGFPRTLAELLEPPTNDSAAVARAFDALRAARRPTILLGHGNRRSVDPEAVVRFARTARIPVATTMSARGDFPNDDPLYLGVAGAAGHPSVHDYIRDQTDLLIVVGAGMNVMTRLPLGSLAEKQIVAINVEPGEIVRALDPAIVIEADASVAVEALTAAFRAAPIEVEAAAEYELRRYVPRLAGTSPPPGSDDLLQSEALAALEPYLPANGHIVLDAGNCASAAIHMTRVPAGSSSTIALGGGGMGYAFAAAVGAQLGSPAGARTVALCGDGAFLINGLEIHTAVDLGLPILFVVFNNQMHGMCATRQQLYFDSRFECVSYAPLDVLQVARGLGPDGTLWVGSAGTLGELRAELDAYHRRSPGPGVLELRLKQEEMPPFSMFLPPDEPTYAVPSVALAKRIDPPSDKPIRRPSVRPTSPIGSPSSHLADREAPLAPLDPPLEGERETGRKTARLARGGGR